MPLPAICPACEPRRDQHSGFSHSVLPLAPGHAPAYVPQRSFLVSLGSLNAKQNLASLCWAQPAAGYLAVYDELLLP